MDLIVDSARRTSGCGSQFTYQITPVEDVRSITLNRATIYNTDYLVNDRNNRIELIFGTAIHNNESTTTITLPIGDITLQDIADAIMSQVPGVTVTIHDELHKLRFTYASIPIRFNASKYPECAQLLGVTDSDHGTNWIASHVYQLRPTRYYRIFVKEFASSTKDSFLLLNNAASAHLSVLDVNPSQTIVCHVSRLTQLTVDIRDEFDNQVELNGTDVLLHVTIN